MSFVNEWTGTKSTSRLGGIIGSVEAAAINLGSVEGRRLIDEAGGRVGLALPNAGQDAVASLSAPRGSGAVSPGVTSARNIASEPRGGITDWIKVHWKIVAGGAVVAVAVWWFAKRRR